MKSEEWQTKRKEIFSIKGNACQKCNTDSHLVIHHGSYKTLGFEDMNHVFVLCNKCHKEFHLLYGTHKILRATQAFIKGEYYEPRKRIPKKTSLKDRRINRKKRQELNI